MAPGQRLLDTAQAVMHGGHQKTVLDQIVAQHFSQLNIVIDQQNCRHSHSINKT